MMIQLTQTASAESETDASDVGVHAYLLPGLHLFPADGVGLQDTQLRDEGMSKNSRAGSAGAVLMFLPDAWISEGNNSLREIKLNGCMNSRPKSLPVSLADPKMMTQLIGCSCARHWAKGFTYITKVISSPFYRREAEA